MSTTTRPRRLRRLRNDMIAYCEELKDLASDIKALHAQVDYCEQASDSELAVFVNLPGMLDQVYNALADAREAVKLLNEALKGNTDTE